MMRRLTFVTLLLTGAMATPLALSGQLKFGIHGARAVDIYGGANGLGASLELGFPAFPVDVFAAGDYFFPDCGGDDGCSFRGGSLDLHFGLPAPVFQPYGAAGLVVRQLDQGDAVGRVTHRGFGVGVGVNLGAALIGGYAEARYEFPSARPPSP
jgi:hypothetical protein